MKSMISVIDIHNKSEWKKTLEGISYSPFHSYEYCFFSSKCLGSSIKLFCYENSEGKVVLPYAVRSRSPDIKDIYTFYGFSGFSGCPKIVNSKEFFGHFLDWGVQNQYITAYIMQNPQTILEESWNRWLKHDHILYVLDLRHEPEILKENMSKSSRYELNALIHDTSYEVIFNKSHLIPVAQNLYRETLDRVHSASGIYYSLLSNLENLLQSDRSLAIGIKKEDEICAVSVFVYNNLSTEYFINAANEKGRGFSRLLIWKAIEYFKKKQINHFNLGGGVRPGDNLDLFKKHWGGRKIQGQSLKIIFNEKKYEVLCKNLKQNENTYFPAYWR